MEKKRKNKFCLIVLESLFLISLLMSACQKKHSSLQESTFEVDRSTTKVGEEQLSADRIRKVRQLLEEIQLDHTLEWDGPTSGPKSTESRFVIFVGSNMANGGISTLVLGLEEAVDVIGWRMKVLDGKGSTSAQVSALNTAIAQQPDGIILGGWLPSAARKSLTRAEKQRIPIVSWHALSHSGPSSEYKIFCNVTTDAREVARAVSLYAIEHGLQHNHSVRAVILTDSNYQIALDKSDMMRNTLEEFGGEVLEYIDTPIAHTSSRMPTLISRLLQEYSRHFYILAINDNYFTSMKASLKELGLQGSGPPFNISAGDGDSAAFARIRYENYQLATVPEPLFLQAWQLIDELNRAIAGAPPSGYVAPILISDQSNIGDQDIYDPKMSYRKAYQKIWGK